MSTENDVARSLRSWLREDRHEDADRVLDAVFDQVPATPQRSASWLERRFPIMKNTFRIGIAAAVVVIAAILGFNYVNSNVGTDTTPTPSQSASPTATPVAVPPLPPEGAGLLEAGRYTIAVPDSPVVAAITIGEGWTTGGWYIMNPPAFTKQVSFWTVGNVHQDWCDPESLPDPAIGPTVDDLVEAFDAQANTDMSPAVDVEVGGFAGKRVTMQFVDLVLCNDTDRLSYFVTPGGGPGRDMEPGRVDTLWIIDVDGHRVVIATSQGDPEDTDATTTIAAVMDSIEFMLP